MIATVSALWPLGSDAAVIRFTPKGFDVSSFTRRTALRNASFVASRVASGSVEPAPTPSTPNPPASLTAATSSGLVSHSIGACTTGLSIPSASHTLFIVIFLFVSPLPCRSYTKRHSSSTPLRV